MQTMVDDLNKLKNDRDGTTKLVKQILGNLTAFQALWRPLRVGEPRAILCKSALQKRKDMFLCVALKKRMATECQFEWSDKDLADDGDEVEEEAPAAPARVD